MLFRSGINMSKITCVDISEFQQGINFNKMKSRGGQRGSDGPSGPGHCQEDRGRAGVPRPDQGQPSAGDQGHRVRQIRQIWSVSKRLPKQLPCRNAAGKLFCLSENQRGIRWLHPRTGFRVSAALCNYESHVLQISASKAAARSVAMIEAFLSF